MLIVCPSLLIVLAASAQTTERQKSLPVPQVARFALRGTNGYRILITAEQKPPQSKSVVTFGLPSVTLLAMHGHEEVTYSTRQVSVTPTAVHASFGRFGAVSVRFIPSGKVLRARRPKSCLLGSDSSIAETRLGSFVGTIRFRGEGDYTAVRANRAKGGVGDFDGPLGAHEKQRHCNSISSTEPRHRAPRRISLDATTKHAALGFMVSPVSPAEGQSPTTVYEFKGFANERRGRLQIARYVYALGPAADFTFNSSLSSATVTPPSPFSGTGTFQENSDDSTSWTGSLSAPLPARGIVHFAGPGFTSELTAN